MRDPRANAELGRIMSVQTLGSHQLKTLLEKKVGHSHEPFWALRQVELQVAAFRLDTNCLQDFSDGVKESWWKGGG